MALISRERELPSRRPRWWQWPTVLSLDAPAVALLWQWLLGWIAAVPLPAPRAFVLGASVWLAYSADRWIEGWRLSPERIRTKRHYFYQRWRWPVAAVWLLVFAADLRAAARGRIGAARAGPGLFVFASAGASSSAMACAEGGLRGTPSGRGCGAFYRHAG